MMKSRIGLSFACAALGLTALAVEMPASLAPVEYIESTAGGGQYIDTGHVPTRNTRIVADIHTMTRSSNWSGFFGAGTHNNSNDAVLLRYFRAENTLNARFCSEIGDKDLKTADYAGMRIAVELKAGSLTINGNVYSIGTTDVSPGVDYPIYLFTINFGNNSDGVAPNQEMRLYSFKIYEGATLKRDFVPCVHVSGGTAGLFDTVEGKFYANAGSGQFKVGKRVNTATDIMPVEYIESTAGGGQYIDTGYMPNQNTRVAMDVEVRGGKEYWFGVWDENWDEGAFGLCNDGNDQGIYYGVGNDGGSFKSGKTKDGCVSNGRRVVEITPYSFLVDGEIWMTKERKADFQLGNNLYLFTQNRKGTAFVAGWLSGIRCYGCKIYEKNVLRRDFMPCIRLSDDAAGLYDKVQGRFYANAGSGQFKVGDRITDIVPVEYIESTTGGGQYIDTGYKPTKDTRIVADFNTMKRSGDWTAFFGLVGEDDSNNADGIIFRYLGPHDKLNAWFLNKESRDVETPALANQRILVELKSKWLTVNGMNYSINTTGTKPYDAPLYVFCANKDNKPWANQAMKLYSFKIYEGSVLKRDFVPCVRLSGLAPVPGLYDKVEDRFYANAGSGQFEVGYLPDGFAPVKYIESTAGGNQYINTGYKPTKDTRIVADFNTMTRSGGWTAFFGVVNDNVPESKGIILRYFDNKASLNAWFLSKNEDSNAVQTSDLERQRIAVELKAGGLTVNGMNYSINTAGTKPYDAPLYVFCANKDNKPWACQAMRLYSFKIYEGYVLKRDFMPCIRLSDDAAGLYDKVERKFYANAGSNPFKVNELPKEYDPIEYIESTAGGGQYIDTGYKPNQDTHVVMDVTVQSATEYWFAVCDKRYCEGAFGVCNDGKEGVYSGYGNQGNSTDKAVANGRHTIELDKNIVKVDGSNIRTFDVCTFQLNNNLYLFASNDAGQHKVATGANQGNIRCHGCKIYEGSVLKRDFVPCIRTADGVLGLYDTVEKKFYGNAGTDRFKFGVLPFGPEVGSGRYTFEKSFSYSAPAGESALKIADGADVTLVIPEGVTVTLRGGDANGTTGAGAGIEVPSNAKLTIEGEGRLVAHGGNAANGADGAKGGDGSFNSDDTYYYSGSGGAGGAGGGGAAAGIGGRGGAGGAGGTGGTSSGAQVNRSNCSGSCGGNGAAGGAGGNCGSVEILGSVEVDVRKGAAAGSGGAGGAGGEWAAKVWTYWYVGYGGGGGGGGGGGVAPDADIGGGGGGGGGAAGGGAGCCEWFGSMFTLPSEDASKHTGFGKGGKGGKTNGSDGKNMDGTMAKLNDKCLEYERGSVRYSDSSPVGAESGNPGSVGGSGSKTAEKTVTFVGLERFLTVRWSFGDGLNVHVLEGDSFTVPSGATNVKVMFSAPDCFALVGDATVNLGTVTSDVTFGGTKGRSMPTVVVPYFRWEGGKLVADSVAVSDCTFVWEGMRTLGGGFYVLMDGVDIDSGLTVDGAAHLILCDGAALTVDGVPVGQSAVTVGAGASLTISGQEDNSGTLTAPGGTNAAGIGGGADEACGTITVDGGTVVATGGTGSDGIGAGRWGEPGTVTTHGGHVTNTHGPAAVTEDGAAFDGVLTVGGKVLRNETVDAVFKVAGTSQAVTLTTDAEGRFAAKIPGVAEDVTSVELVKVGDKDVSGSKIMRLPRVTYALVAAEADAVVSDEELAVVDGTIEVTGDLTAAALEVDGTVDVAREAVRVSEVEAATITDLYGVRADGGRIRWIGPEEQVLDAQFPSSTKLIGWGEDVNQRPWYACLTMDAGTDLTGETANQYFTPVSEKRAVHFNVHFMEAPAKDSNFPPADPAKDESAFNAITEDNVFTAPGDGFCRLRVYRSNYAHGGVALSLRVEDEDGAMRNLLDPGWIQGPTRFQDSRKLERSQTFAVRRGDKVHLRLLYSEGYVDGRCNELNIFELGVQMYFRRMGTVKE